MALVKCVECGREVSDKAAACPHCGCPIECSSNVSAPAAPIMNGTPQPTQSEQVNEIMSKTKMKLLLISGGLVLIAVFLIVGVLSVGGSGSDPDENYGGYYSSSYNNNYSSTYNNNNNNNIGSNHTHTYFTLVTKYATCAQEGVTTHKCTCGHSYTEPIPKTEHIWSLANCAEPSTCEECGAKSSAPRKEHTYLPNGKCVSCNAMDPLVNQTISKCSLKLPTLPKTINSYYADGSLSSSVRVTDIKYTFKYEGNGTVSLKAKFSGTKTYYSRGSNHSSHCEIGWKLYDANGNVVNAGTVTSPQIAVGENFVDKEEDMIYNFNNAAPGAYRLEILDVH